MHVYLQTKYIINSCCSCSFQPATGGEELLIKWWSSLKASKVTVPLNVLDCFAGNRTLVLCLFMVYKATLLLNKASKANNQAPPVCKGKGERTQCVTFSSPSAAEYSEHELCAHIMTEVLLHWLEITDFTFNNMCNIKLFFSFLDSHILTNLQYIWTTS